MFMRIRKLPVCQQCGRDIATDFCFQMDEDKWNTESLICESCRDKAVRKFRGTFLEDIMEDFFQEKLETTEQFVVEYDIVDTRFEKLYA